MPRRRCIACERPRVDFLYCAVCRQAVNARHQRLVTQRRQARTGWATLAAAALDVPQSVPASTPQIRGFVHEIPPEMPNAVACHGRWHVIRQIPTTLPCCGRVLQMQEEAP